MMNKRLTAIILSILITALAVIPAAAVSASSGSGENAALILGDADADGTVGFSGGTVIALCTTNAMWQDITGKIGSAVYNQSIGTVSKGSTVCVTDASGNVLAAVKSNLSGSLGVLFYSGEATLSGVKFVTGGSYSGTLNSYGYGSGGTVTGGSSYSPSTSSGGGQPGGRPGGR